MNKGDLINKIADSANLNKTQAGEALNAVLDGIADALKDGDKVTLIGFGTFSVSKLFAPLRIQRFLEYGNFAYVLLGTLIG